MKKLAITLLSFTVLSSCASAGSTDQWQKFLSEPSEGNFILVLSLLSKEETCNLETSSFKILKNESSRLFQLIKSGNDFAFELGARTLSCFDGGTLGDLYRAGGQFFDLKPLKFFQVIETVPIDKDSLRYFSTMLPLSTVDDIPAKKAIIVSRIENTDSVESEVDSETFTEVKNHLQRELEFLSSLNNN